jgi:hypothetical protein
MPSLIAEEMRRSYLAQRGVSQGAGITLVSASQGWVARLDCAKRCALVLGERYSADFGEGEICGIPNEEMARALAKLSESFSVALVDTVTDDQGTRFVLIYKIPAAVKPEQEIAPDPNQGSLDLDEY